MIQRLIAAFGCTLLLLGALPANAQRAPQGTYLQSCTNVRVRGGNLVANCTAPNGQRIESSTDVACSGDIGNVNGYLRCNGGHRPGGGRPGGGHHGEGPGGIGLGGDPPNGTYRQSCTNVRMRGTMLVANCSAANGGRITSSLNVFDCRRHSDIGNHNGYLSCRR